MPGKRDKRKLNMVKVLGILGSPRKGGNSDMLLDAALDGARSKGAAVEKIVLNDMNFRPCQECGLCDKTGICAIDDDMTVIYKKIKDADVLIIASPIFFASLSAQLKMMIDRFQCSWIGKYALKGSADLAKKRRGLLLCVSGSRKRKFFANAKETIKVFFATLDIEYSGELFYGGVDEKRAITGKKGALEKASRLGVVLVESF